MSPKVVGVMPLYDEEKCSYWMLPDYFKMLERCGVIPIMLPLSTDGKILDYFLDYCDGFLFTGGQDVSPSLYGEEPSSLCGEACADRDTMDCYMLNHLYNMDKPVLGICRGIQIMNACFGGSLYQDLPSQHPSDIDHHMTPPYDRAVHKVYIKKDSPLYDITGCEELAVNSYHHQAVKETASKLTAIAESEDGLTEAVCVPDKKFFMALQWHPELSYKSDSHSLGIVQAFCHAVLS